MNWLLTGIRPRLTVLKSGIATRRVRELPAAGAGCAAGSVVSRRQERPPGSMRPSGFLMKPDWKVMIAVRKRASNIPFRSPTSNPRPFNRRCTRRTSSGSLNPPSPTEALSVSVMTGYSVYKTLHSVRRRTSRRCLFTSRMTRNPSGHLSRSRPGIKEWPIIFGVHHRRQCRLHVNELSTMPGRAGMRRIRPVQRPAPQSGVGDTAGDPDP